MQISVDISLYPLHKDYKNEIIQFIETLKLDTNIRIAVNGMSTQVYGEFNVVMSTLQREMEKVLSNETRSVMILKISQGELTADKIPSHLK